MNEAERFFAERARLKRFRTLKTPVDTTTVVSVKRVSQRGNAYQHTRTGYRPLVGVVCRSGWEANVLMVLSGLGIAWEFEPQIFTFPIVRGIKGYLPDIFLTKTGEYIEIKGYFDDASRIKIKRFKKYYPEEFSKLTMIISRSSKAAIKICNDLGVPNVLFYEDISDGFKSKIPDWEGK